jgi:type IV pilus assembly protein PilV
VHSSLEVLGYSFTVVGHEVQSSKFKAIAGEVAGGEGMHNKQWGMTLIEVLLAVLVVAVGMFAAAGLQLKALQATDSARRDAQAMLAQYSEQERSPR